MRLETPASDTSGTRTQPAPYNPAGVFLPGSPENEDFVHGTMRVLRGIGRVFHSEQQDDPDGESARAGDPAPALLANPDDLLQQGWEEITHPDAAAAGHREFRNKTTGLVIRADKGDPSKPGIAVPIIIIPTIPTRPATVIFTQTGIVGPCLVELRHPLSYQEKSRGKSHRDS